MRKRDTLGNKKSLNRAYFAHELLVYSNLIKLGVKWAVRGPLQVWRPTKTCETN
jgi:hypothetical protein